MSMCIKSKGSVILLSTEWKWGLEWERGGGKVAQMRPSVLRECVLDFFGLKERDI